MQRIAKVIDTDESGKIQIEVIPEFQNFRKDLLPWAVPVQDFDSSGDFKIDLPAKDSYVLVEINNTWTSFSYDGSRPYVENKDQMDNAYNFLADNFDLGGDNFKPDKVDFSSNPNYMEFRDSTSGIAGILFSNGRFICWTGKDGKTLVYGTGDKKFFEFNEDGSFTYNNHASDVTSINVNSNGNVSITCRDASTIEMTDQKVKINGDNLVIDV